MCLTLANLHWSFEVKTSFVFFSCANLEIQASCTTKRRQAKWLTTSSPPEYLSVPFHWNRSPIPGGKKQWREAADIWFIHGRWKNHSKTWRELIHRNNFYSHARFIDFLLLSLRSLIQQSASFHSTWDNASWQPLVSKPLHAPLATQTPWCLTADFPRPSLVRLICRKWEAFSLDLFKVIFLLSTMVNHH